MSDTPKSDFPDTLTRVASPKNRDHQSRWPADIGLAIFFGISTLAIALLIDLISVDRRSEMVQFIANSAASAAAQGLPMVNSSTEEIQRVREKLSGCHNSTTAISAVQTEIGEVDIMTIVMNGFTGVEVLVKTPSGSIFGRFSPFGSAPINAQAVAILVGSGKTAVVPSYSETDGRAPGIDRLNKTSSGCEV
ncbi:MAG: hypothetical protein AB3N20_15100 [Rhizobiaceae bacterium]